jgi:hypothetical protein
MNKIFLLFICTSIFICSCGKNNEGIAEAQGGQLPTNYIYFKNGKFSPTNTTAVNGSSFTFVNQTENAIGIYSSDSAVINKQGIAGNTSFIFKKDTTGTLIYFLAGNQNVNGTITLTP